MAEFVGETAARLGTEGVEAKEVGGGAGGRTYRGWGRAESRGRGGAAVVWKVAAAEGKEKEGKEAGGLGIARTVYGR